MKQGLLALVAAAVISAAPAAHASVINFNNPGLIDINGNTATYTEAGYKITGQAADFLLLDNGAGNGFLVGGFLGAQYFSLMSDTGAAFSLNSLNYDYFDLGDPAGILTVSGLLAGVQTVSTSFNLGGGAGLRTATFTGLWRNVSEVRFSATSGFILDNINAVPEPGSLALAAAALMALVMSGGARRTLKASD